MQGLTIKMADSPDTAPVYRAPEHKGGELLEAVVVQRGLESGEPSVDLIFVDESGQKYIAMTTFALLNGVIIAGNARKEALDAAEGKAPADDTAVSENQYPRGKLNADDEGQLALRMAVKDGTVVMDFGKPVAWMGFGPEDAVNLAQMLIQNAIKAGFPHPVSISVGDDAGEAPTTTR